MEIFAIGYSIFFIFIFSGFLHFGVVKILRNNYYFITFLIISVFVYFLSLVNIFTTDELSKKEILNLNLPIFPILHLFIYKKLDDYYLSKFKRHIIFTPKYNFPYDEEYNLQTGTELFIQIILSIYPFLIIYLSSLLIK